MGSCISKCVRKKKLKEECSCSHVHDKLVISQDHPKSIPYCNSTLTPATESKPESLTPSHSSTFSCSDKSKSFATMASSISSASSCDSSSVLIGSKDRSFSNEFLWSCVKENPHVIGLKKQTTLEKPNRTPLRNLQHSVESSPFVTRTLLPVQENLITGSTPKKRARVNSPTLVRQKSFRKEHNRGLRSPSPSRRFNVGGNDRSFLPDDQNSCKGHIFSKAGVKKESFRLPTMSPNRDYVIKRNVLVRKMDGSSHQACKKIAGDDHGVGEDIQSRQGLDIGMEEDMNNPLIALDCFIFL